MTDFRDVDAGTDCQPSGNEAGSAGHLLSTFHWVDARSLNPWKATVLGNPAMGFKLVHDRTKVVRSLAAADLNSAMTEAIELGVATPGGLDALLASTTTIPRQNRSGNIYFVAGENGPIKIGFAESPTRRLAGMQTGSPLVLSILATVPGTEADERAYHARFRKHRLHGEWFERCPEILEEIERLQKELV